jgi:thiol-disulfide isomerase/thioredoxin
MKKILIMIIALTLFIGGCSKQGKEEDINQVENNIEDSQTPDEQTPEEDEDIIIEAPDFTLKNLQGEEVSLSDYRGKIVLINFWATWCTWCDKEMPDLQRLDNENDDLVVLAVDVMEDKKTVEKYIEKGKYEFEVVLDEDGEVSQTYLVSGFPRSYFVDKDGILLGGVPGAMTYEQMVEILESIRGEK